MNHIYSFLHLSYLKCNNNHLYVLSLLSTFNVKFDWTSNIASIFLALLPVVVAGGVIFVTEGGGVVTGGWCVLDGVTGIITYNKLLNYKLYYDKWKQPFN